MGTMQVNNLPNGVVFNKFANIKRNIKMDKQFIINEIYKTIKPNIKESENDLIEDYIPASLLPNMQRDLANLVEKLVRQGVPQPVFACGHCVDCKHYEKIDDTEVQHEETFWETCHHPDINEMLVWDCEQIGCTEFEKRASKSA